MSRRKRAADKRGSMPGVLTKPKPGMNDEEIRGMAQDMYAALTERMAADAAGQHVGGVKHIRPDPTRATDVEPWTPERLGALVRSAIPGVLVKVGRGGYPLAGSTDLAAAWLHSRCWPPEVRIPLRRRFLVIAAEQGWLKGLVLGAIQGQADVDPLTRWIGKDRVAVHRDDMTDVVFALDPNGFVSRADIVSKKDPSGESSADPLA